MKPTYLMIRTNMFDGTPTHELTDSVVNIFEYVRGIYNSSTPLNLSIADIRKYGKFSHGLDINDSLFSTTNHDDDSNIPHQIALSIPEIPLNMDDDELRKWCQGLQRSSILNQMAANKTRQDNFTRLTGTFTDNLVEFLRRITAGYLSEHETKGLLDDIYQLIRTTGEHEVDAESTIAFNLISKLARRVERMHPHAKPIREIGLMLLDECHKYNMLSNSTYDNIHNYVNRHGFGTLSADGLTVIRK